MSKNDFRVQFPLWNIALWIILMIWTYGVVYSVDMILSGFEGVYGIVNGELIINLHIPGLLSIIVGLLLLVVFFIAYFKRLKQHNRENPSHKMTAFSFLKPGEFLEDDELLCQVTENATKKVYVLYSQALPLIIFFLVVLPFNRYVYIVMLFLLLIVHNALFYREIRKYISGEYKLNSVREPKNNKIQKLILVLITLIILISIAIPTARILKIENNKKESLQEFEACLREGKTAVMEFEENGFTSVKCD